MELRRKIEEEKEDLKKLQHPPKANSLATEGTNKGEKINDIIVCSSEKSGKSLQIVNYVWPEPIPQYQTITLAGDMEFRVGNNLVQITIVGEDHFYPMDGKFVGALTVTHATAKIVK